MTAKCNQENKIQRKLNLNNKKSISGRDRKPTTDKGEGKDFKKEGKENFQKEIQRENKPKKWGGRNRTDNKK